MTIGFKNANSVAAEPPFPFARAVMRWILAVFFAAAGVAHLAAPDALLSITPDWVPFAPQVIALTGLFELAAAAALVTWPLRAWAAVALALYAVCVWPANFKHAIDHIDIPHIHRAGGITGRGSRFSPSSPGGHCSAAASSTGRGGGGQAGHRATLNRNALRGSGTSRRSTAPALLCFAIQPVRQAAGFAFCRAGGFSFGGGRRPCSGAVSCQSEGFQPLGLRSQGCRRGFVVGRRLFCVVRALYFCELRARLMIFGFRHRSTILFRRIVRTRKHISARARLASVMRRPISRWMARTPA